MGSEDAAVPETRERLHLRFGFADIRPDPRDLCCALGYPPGETPEVALDAIESIVARGEGLWSPEGGVVIHTGLGVDRPRQRLVAGEVPFEAGKIVCGQFSGASAVGVFLCTVGPGISDLMDELMAAGDPFTSYVASWMGSLAVERVTDRVQEALARRAAAAGLAITNRYSPGYCGWHVSEQHKLFRLLPPGFCGVRLTETSLMQPIKSVSGFIGLGERVRFNPYTCNLCEREDCISRTVRAAREARGAARPVPS
ncbi:MAG TPA: vitamin B12 dependent-methionine synthase activation domain-containing protein [Anaeromyxobacteraceae bacterium]|nr:vitamin B12 dependent-methionine synthase activation domain-containing protein [Anaeromyxobacteraceae bacterium]